MVHININNYNHQHVKTKEVLCIKNKDRNSILSLLSFNFSQYFRDYGDGGIIQCGVINTTASGKTNQKMINSRRGQHLILLV